MFSKLITICIICIVIIAAIIFWQCFAYKTPEPAFRLIKSDNNIEIREYPELIVAEVIVSGERYASINNGFRILANYIFGGNKRNQKIAMTAPVEQIPSKDGWIIRFIMPAEFTLATLPAPNNASIKFTSIKSKRFAAIRFRGLNSDENINTHTKILLNYINNNGIKTVGEPIMAFYNPPWILPFLRRNEIIIELQ